MFVRDKRMKVSDTHHPALSPFDLMYSDVAFMFGNFLASTTGQPSCKC
jgi:hypothetical protein